MGTESTYPGVEIHRGKVRISFQLAGRRCREYLPGYKPTPAGMKQAAKIREEIRGAIKRGAFNYADYFPDSPRAKNSSGGRLSVREVGDEYLAADPTRSASTINGYRKALEAHIYPDLGDRLICDITYRDLSEIINVSGWKSQKTRNNVLTPIRGMFAHARRFKYITEDPSAELQFGAVQKPPPDPLELPEVDKILGRLERTAPSEIRNYFEFAIFSGLRTSELIALEWGDVDFNRGLVRVSRAKVVGEVKNTTKTYRVRDVELNSRSLAALKRQKALTMLRGDTIFINPVQGRPFHDDKVPRRYWKAALLGCGIRYRVAYQTRHTFATLNLMAGANPMWVADQLGHKNMKMVLEVYSRWIGGADKRREVGKLDAMLSR